MMVLVNCEEMKGQYWAKMKEVELQHLEKGET